MKQYHKRVSALFLLLAVLLIGNQRSSLAQQYEGPKKIAFIVGVSEYQKDGLANLKYAHKDANDLSRELASQGFKVTKLIGRHAKHDEVRKGFSAFIEAAADLGKDDVVLVSFSGHGVQKQVKTDGKLVETPFFCVYDTMVNKPSTMISLNKVLTHLKEHSGCSSNLLVVDACRNNPDKGARTLDGSTVKELPTKISMLFSSSPGQKSYESEKVKQGIFTHVLLKGLKGESANSRGQVKWASLATYVLEEVPLHVTDLLEDSSIEQRPNLVGNFVRSPTLNQPSMVSPLVAPFGKREIASAISALGQSKGMKSVVKNDIGMEFRLIPAGTFMMGVGEQQKRELYTPERRKDYKGNEITFDEFLKSEQQHEVELTKPFYMAKYEVTNNQWDLVMGEKTSNEKGLDISNRPAELGWEESQEFINRLNRDFGIPGYRYRLPTEAEWEYSCRAGTSTHFHFGDSLTPDDANVESSYPEGVKSSKEASGTTVAVGSYRSNAFGLYDMHGNVAEWCQDWSDAPDWDYYQKSPRKDPMNDIRPAGSYSSHISRGGCYT